MSYYYSDSEHKNDSYALPNVWVTHLTAHEVAETMQDEAHEFMKRPEYRLASIDGRVVNAMLDAMVTELDIKGGYCWCYCFPGCMPDSDWHGPFETEAEAVEDMRNRQN